MAHRGIVSVAAIVLTFVGYAPYLRDTLKKRTKPHTFTWFIAALAGYIEFGLQVVGGAGTGAAVLFTASFVCLLIFLLSLRIRDKDIVPADVVCLILSLASLFLWLVVREPVWAVLLINLVEALGFGPTVRKSWNNPYSETLWAYEVSALRHFLTVFALERVNILTALTPITSTLISATVGAVLIGRRRALRNRWDRGAARKKRAVTQETAS